MARKKRDYPCLCISCPDCGAVFMAIATKYLDEKDIQILADIRKYAKDGYNASFKDSSEFKIDMCEHIKQPSTS
jgi:hypothetical protein